MENLFSSVDDSRCFTSPFYEARIILPLDSIIKARDDFSEWRLMTFHFIFFEFSGGFLFIQKGKCKMFPQKTSLCGTIKCICY